MNCLEVHRRLLLNPEDQSELVAQHLRECPACRQHAQRMQHQEANLRAALEVPIPEHLEQILLQRIHPRSNRKPALTWAASLALAVFVGLAWVRPGGDNTPHWCDVMLAHALNEPEALSASGQVDATQVQAALARFDLQPGPDLGRVRFLAPCELPGGKGLHLVMDTELGTVTLVLAPPGTHTTPQSQVREGHSTQVMARGNTSLGIIVSPPQPDQVTAAWLQRALAG